MNKASFLSLVRQASRISDQEVEELEKLIVNFPYCQTAHLLIAKAAYDKGSMLSNQKLKKAAIYAANRQLLKKLIYTSDATVALQPVTPEKSVSESELASVTETPVIETPAIAQTETIANNTLTETGITAAQDFVEAVVETETLSEPAEKAELIEIPEQLHPEISLTDKPVTIASEFIPEISIAEIIAQTDHEDAAIAEEILEEGHLPLTESEFLASTDLEALSQTETQETVASKPEIERQQGIEMLAKASANTPAGEISPVAELPDTDTLKELETIPFGIEKVAGPSGEALTEAELDDVGILAEEIEMAAAFKNPEIHHPPVYENAGPVIEGAETELPTVEPETEEIAVETQPTALNDELLNETLASFDQYLFKPEKEHLEIAPEEDVKVVVPLNEIEAIYANDSIGYWMNSSRMGESLETKNDLTHQKPYDFHPELLWEYNKTNELHREIKPAPSKLSHQLDIIDNFLKMTPRLKAMANAKVKTEAQEDLSLKSSKINKNLASENFANILIQQGKIKKAIKIYEHLILKIPEKKAYFVSQIEKLQNPE